MEKSYKEILDIMWKEILKYADELEESSNKLCKDDDDGLKLLTDDLVKSMRNFIWNEIKEKNYHEN